MGSKYKMTGCARFFLVMLILAPLAYLGAAYYNGQDGLANIKSVFSSDDNSGSQAERPAPAQPDDTKDMEDAIEEHQAQIDQIQGENVQLKEKIQELEEANAKLQAEIDALKSAPEGGENENG